VFRCADSWCTFVVANGRAKRREIKIGQRNANEAEVLAGLSAGETVIRHPANTIEDGARVESR
jgi:HlyD family secretion protein